MKKLLLTVTIVIIAFIANSQDVNRKFGIGLQSSFPVYGISVKYGLNENSVIQATIAPFGVSVDGGSFSMNYYGARYIYRFPGDDGGSVVLDPYLFGGGGMISYTSNMTAYGGTKTTDNFFGYSVGGGVELIVARKLGISAELGYGKLSISGGVGVNTMLLGGGLHFYIN